MDTETSPHSPSQEDQQEEPHPDTHLASKLHIYVFSTGGFPFPVPSGTTITYPPAGDFLIWDICNAVYGPTRAAEAKGTFIISQPTRLERVRGPTYWHSSRNFDTLPLRVRRGDPRTFSESGWRIEQDQVWLQVNFERDGAGGLDEGQLGGDEPGEGGPQEGGPEEDRLEEGEPEESEPGYDNPQEDDLEESKLENGESEKPAPQGEELSSSRLNVHPNTRSLPVSSAVTRVLRSSKRVGPKYS